jgi:hypothetical protein
MGQDKTNLRDFSDEELRAALEGHRDLHIEAELRARGARLGMAQVEEEREFRKSGKPRRLREEWQRLWQKEVADVATALGVDLARVTDVALQIEKELL